MWRDSAKYVGLSLAHSELGMIVADTGFASKPIFQLKITTVGSVLLE